MTRKIRKNVFETNSSSSHSLTLSEGDLVEQPFSAEVLRSGVLPVVVDDYAWAFKRLYLPENKISYLLTQLTDGRLPTEGDITAQLREEHPRFETLFRVVKEHTGVELQVLSSEGGIDHQSVGEGMQLFEDEHALKRFIFGRDSYVQTGNDNNYAPVSMPTDRGSSDHTYSKFYADVLPGMMAVDFKFENYCYDISTPSGDVIEKDAPLMAELIAAGVVSAVTWENSDRMDPFKYTKPLVYTMVRLSRQGFRFVESIGVTVHQLPRPKVRDEENTVATVTLMLPPQLALRFVREH